MESKRINKKRIFSNNNINMLLSFADLGITFFSFLLAYILTEKWVKNLDFDHEVMIMLLLILPTWAILLKISTLSTVPRVRRELDMFFHFLKFGVLGFLIILAFKYTFDLYFVSHYLLVIFSILNVILLFTFRMVTFKSLKRYRATGHNISNVILYADASSQDMIQKIIEHKEWGYRILAIATDSENIRKKYRSTLRVFPDKINVKNLMDIDIVDEIIYCKEDFNKEKLKQLIRDCKEVGVSFRLQSEFYQVSDIHHKTNIDFPLELIDYKSRSYIATVWKSFTDFWISFGILFLISPILVVISLLIKLSSKGPVIFKQERVGLRGRKFYLYKFRTMVQNAEELKAELEKYNESDGPAFKIKKDPRITLIGRVLRKTGLDELPQLFNVLKGEMSLIGPRPPIASEVEKYERWYLKRLSVKPGITCTWQIIPNRNEVLFENWMKLDVQYVENWSLKKDAILFFQTIKTVFTGTGY